MKNLWKVFVVALAAILVAAGPYFTSLYVSDKIVNTGSTLLYGKVVLDTVLVPVGTYVSGSTLTLPEHGSLFILSDTVGQITRILPGTGSATGRIVSFYSKPTVNKDTLVDGVNLKLASTFNGTVDDIITLVQIDTFFVEMYRSAN